MAQVGNSAARRQLFCNRASGRTRFAPLVTVRHGCILFIDNYAHRFYFRLYSGVYVIKAERSVVFGRTIAVG